MPTSGIRVNTVVPAYTETSLVTTITSDPEARAAIIGRIPLGRAGSPADVEGIMVFLGARRRRVRDRVAVRASTAA